MLNEFIERASDAYAIEITFLKYPIFEGRLDRAIYVGLPSPETRRAIIRMRTSRMVLAEDDIVEKLVNRTEGQFRRVVLFQ